MYVTVRVFARLRELAGRSEWRCEMPSGASAADLWRVVAEAHPALVTFRAVVSCAVNAEFAPMTTILEDGDDVAFLPPVSGGTSSLLPTSDLIA